MRILAALSCAFLLVGTIAAPGNATDSLAKEDISTIKIVSQGGDGKLSTALEIQLDNGLSVTEAVEQVKDLGGENIGFDNGILTATSSSATEILSPTTGSDSVAPLAQPNNAPIPRGRTFEFGDNNGTYTIQHGCFVNSAAWGYKISPQIQAIVVAGKVNEEGMKWWRNGAFVQQNTGHNTGANYHFHGTYTQVHHGTTIRYEDKITFRHNIGVGGDASLSLNGSMIFSK